MVTPSLGERITGFNLMIFMAKVEGSRSALADQ